MYVHWHEGLFLQPHHLQAMQRRLQTDIRAARALFIPYGFGVVESRVSHDDLADGRIRFERLRVIMPSGQEILFPDDATLPALDIKTELVRGAGPLEVLLAIPLWTRGRANAFRLGERHDPRIKMLFVPEEARDIADENSGDNPQPLHFRKINARVVLKGEDLSDMEFLPLMRVVRASGDEEAKTRQDPEFVPPCVLLKSSPILLDMMRELAAQLNATRTDLQVKLSTGGHGLETKWELTMFLGVLNRACGSLPSIVEEGTIQPFALYLELRRLFGELLSLHPGKAEFDCEAYNHLDPYRSFKQLDQKIRGLIRLKKGTEPLRILFAGTSGMLRATLEPQHFDKPSGYFLGVRTRTDRTKLSVYLTDGNKFKVMPRSMEQVAIFGIELKEEQYPPHELPSQNDLHYFRILPASNQRRWDQIKLDKAISLVWNNSEFDLSDATVALYMTLPSSP